MEMSGFLNNIAISLEKIVGAQLSKGEYRLGTMDLNSVSEIAPLNQRAPGSRNALNYRILNTLVF